jgi:macrolide transport system ATP-binding/permease protein
VTISDSPLLGAGMSGTGLSIGGRDLRSTPVLTVGPDFFTTMQIPLLRGRAIDERDRPGAPYVAVVNEAFVVKYFGGDDPIGQHVKLPRACAECDIEIVGVSGNARYGQLKEAASTTIFLSYSQAVWGPISEATYQLRTAGNPLGAVSAVREIVERADSRVPLTQVKTQRALIEGTINQEVTFARLCTAFALLALAIACVGLYGTISYGVSRRTSEIGVRMALGARSGTLIWMELRDVFALAGIGLAISLPAALAASKLVESFLFQMKRNDPLALAAAVLTMAAATLLAGYIPARNASRINPMAALRHE